MSSNSSPNAQERKMLLQKVVDEIYENSTAAVFFHTIIAQQVGLGATEEKTLLILNGKGAMTAGEIARATGLTTSSVTSLIDRLEEKGFVRRVRDAHDRRKVIVEPDREKFADLAKLFGALESKLVSSLEEYSDSELVLIAQFLRKATEGGREVTAKLSKSLDRNKVES